MVAINCGMYASPNKPSILINGDNSSTGMEDIMKVIGDKRSKIVIVGSEAYRTKWLGTIERARLMAVNERREKKIRMKLRKRLTKKDRQRLRRQLNKK